MDHCFIPLFPHSMGKSFQQEMFYHILCSPCQCFLFCIQSFTKYVDTSLKPVNISPKFKISGLHHMPSIISPLFNGGKNHEVNWWPVSFYQQKQTFKKSSYYHFAEQQVFSGEACYHLHMHPYTCRSVQSVINRTCK